MADKEFILQRIRIFTGSDIDPSDDKQVNEQLRSKLDIHLPQRRTMDESLAAARSEHDIIGLILKYRSM